MAFVVLEVDRNSQNNYLRRKTCFCHFGQEFNSPHLHHNGARHYCLSLLLQWLDKLSCFFFQNLLICKNFLRTLMIFDALVEYPKISNYNKTTPKMYKKDKKGQNNQKNYKKHKK